jgi:hypothetical protein
MVIKCTKLYDPEAYNSVSILPTGFLYVEAILRDITTSSLVIQCTRLYNLEAFGSVSNLPKGFNTK